MYTEFYGLKEVPFALTPDPRYLYFTPSHTEVMANLHYGIESGRGLIVVTGEVGTGKTTLLRVASGLLTPEAGVVCLCDLHPRRDRREYQRRLGFLSAGDRGLYARLTVQRQLDFWTRLFFIPRGERTAAVETALDRFELRDLKNRRLDRMSQGQRQRVRLASAFIHSPALLLLDEPANSLDEDGVAMLAGAVRRHVEAGGAAIWCSPSGEPRDLPCTASYRLERGRLVEA
jgi:ABC-type multidrug transport system ATPase subunit